jgi:hypothetical protein
MKHIYLLLLSLLFVAALLVGIPYSWAASNLQVYIRPSSPTGRGYQIDGNADTPDVGDQDYVCVVCRNSDGSVDDVDITHYTVGNIIDATGGCDANYPGSTASKPYSVVIYDVTGPFAGPGTEDSPGGLAYCESFAPPPPSSPSSGGSQSVNAVPGPGPDMIFLPEWAVVGTFTETTPLYYYPAPGAASDSSMNSGQSLWVLGLDPTGAFYQVVISGKYLWVPVETIGPTFDAPWYGHPLPTEVVEL